MKCAVYGRSRAGWNRGASLSGVVDGVIALRACPSSGVMTGLRVGVGVTRLGPYDVIKSGAAGFLMKIEGDDRGAPHLC